MRERLFVILWGPKILGSRGTFKRALMRSVKQQLCVVLVEQLLTISRIFAHKSNSIDFYFISYHYHQLNIYIYIYIYSNIFNGKSG